MCVVTPCPCVHVDFPLKTGEAVGGVRGQSGRSLRSLLMGEGRGRPTRAQKRQTHHQRRETWRKSKEENQEKPTDGTEEEVESIYRLFFLSFFVFPRVRFMSYSPKVFFLV